MGLEGPRDVCSDERVASAEVGVYAALLLDTREGGVLPPTGCNLSAVFNRKQAEIAVDLLEHEVVCHPDLFRGGMEGKSGICEARSGESGVGAVFGAVFFGLGSLEVDGNGGTPGRVVGHKFFFFLFFWVNEASWYRFMYLLLCNRGHRWMAAVRESGYELIFCSA